MVNSVLEEVKIVVTGQASSWESEVVCKKKLHRQLTSPTSIRRKFGCFFVSCMSWWVLVINVKTNVRS